MKLLVALATSARKVCLPGIFLSCYAAIVGAIGYMVVSFVFGRTFISFDNHDSAAPWLLAAPLAFAAFVVAASVAFVVITRLLGRVFGAARKPD